MGIWISHIGGANPMESCGAGVCRSATDFPDFLCHKMALVAPSGMFGRTVTLAWQYLDVKSFLAILIEFHGMIFSIWRRASTSEIFMSCIDTGRNPDRRAKFCLSRTSQHDAKTRHRILMNALFPFLALLPENLKKMRYIQFSYCAATIFGQTSKKDSSTFSSETVNWSTFRK